MMQLHRIYYDFLGRFLFRTLRVKLDINLCFLLIYMGEVDCLTFCAPKHNNIKRVRDHLSHVSRRRLLFCVAIITNSDR
jgi:hypothetical protein